jgi:hypothetical protein
MNIPVSVRRTALMAALAVLFLSRLAGPLQAADAPFTFAGNVKFVESVKQFHVFAWEGRATQLGPCTGVGLVFEGGYTRHAYVTLENDRGDSIDFYIEWVRDRQTGESIGIYEITGGTGRFVDAGGSGNFHAIPRDAAALVTLDGTISY